MQIETPGECCGVLMFFNFNEYKNRENVLEEMRRSAYERISDDSDRNRTIFAIVSNRQKGLKEVLKDIGFDAIYDFAGTYVWGNGGPAKLTMMVYNQQEKGALPIWKDEEYDCKI